jgi:hypothetical protein
MNDNDRNTFYDIVSIIKDAYLAICQAFNEQTSEKQLEKEITTIIKDKFNREVNKYGWSDSERLPGVVAERIFHETFSELSQTMYAIYLQNSYLELGLDEPFFLEDNLEEEKQELEKIYKEEKITLTDDAYISEMKKALHYHLFTMYTDLKEILLSEQHIQHIKPSTKYSEKELVVKLEQEMKEMRELRNQMDELLNRMQSLDERYNI